MSGILDIFESIFLNQNQRILIQISHILFLMAQLTIIRIGSSNGLVTERHQAFTLTYDDRIWYIYIYVYICVCVYIYVCATEIFESKDGKSFW